jgi:hypothetical protein
MAICPDGPFIETPMPTQTGQPTGGDIERQSPGALTLRCHWFPGPAFEGW